MTASERRLDRLCLIIDEMIHVMSQFRKGLRVLDGELSNWEMRMTMTILLSLI